MTDTFKYIIGSDRAEVVEKKSFSQSIFAEQYGRALNIVSDYLRYPTANALQIVAFCGDRGEGKSSSMLSFGNLLSSINSNQPFAEEYLENKNRKHLFNQEKFLLLDLIDPSFFNDEYNILEYFIGTLYNRVKKIIESNQESSNHDIYTDMLISFQNVKRAISMMHGSPDKKFDPLDEIGNLALGLKLKGELAKLVKNVLKFTGYSKIIIMIDDIDLNMDGAYRMAEHIRQYLCIPEIMLLLAVNIEQLQRVIANNFYKQFPSSLIESRMDSAEEMANKYIEKLIPIGNRISMPRVHNLCEQKLIVTTSSGEVVYENEKVKNGIVELIFLKTRYLFYNTKGGVNKIVPDNLRLLSHLLGMLSSMPDIGENHENHFENQHEFQNYFFSVWTKRFDESIRTVMLEWANSPTDNALNSNIVNFLANNYDLQELLKREYGNNEQEEQSAEYTKRRNEFLSKNSDATIDSIIDSGNFSYNISAGDLFYLLNCLEKDNISSEAEDILFFIRNLYSIKLYQNYDVISEEKGQLYPVDRDYRGIYRNDTRFLHTNVLQRMVNGAYFTYRPGDFVAHNLQDTPIDTRVILGHKFTPSNSTHHGLNYLINQVINKHRHYATMSIKEKDLFHLQLQIAEFFILTTSRSISSKKKDKLKEALYPQEDLNNRRRDVNPIYYDKYKASTGYYVFDILAPFTNLLNPEYAYSRFGKNYNEIFEIAISCKESLIYKLIRAALISRGETTKELDTMLNYLDGQLNQDAAYRNIYNSFLPVLLSDATIRNAEVLMALNEDLRNKRENLSRLGSAASRGYARTLADFYKMAIYNDSESMTTHKRSLNNEGNNRHCIKFGFLNGFADFLNILATDENAVSVDGIEIDVIKEAHNIFLDIYNPMLNLSDEDIKIRLVYIVNLLPDKIAKYSPSELTKVLEKKIPGATDYIKDFRLKLKGRTAKTPMQWFDFLYKNYDVIESLIESNTFENHIQRSGMDALEEALMNLLEPENQAKM